jgi:calcium-translocating P-type ATPase
MNTKERKKEMKIFGLNDAEMSASKEKYGTNRLTEQETEGFWAKLKDNFGDPMIKILCVALAINVVLVIGSYMGWIADKMAWYEPVGIAVAILLATLVSTFSEYRNENAFQKLQEEASKIQCKVYRNGEITEIPIDDIVVDDAILLQAGDKVPADGIIIDGTIKVDQSVLNGESKEAAKVAVPPGYKDEETAMDFLNQYKVFRGAVVYSGNAVMQVTVVGDKSVYGQIAKELQTEEERDTPLKVKLGGLAGTISKFGYIGGVAIAVALLFQRIVIHNNFDLVLMSNYISNWSHIVSDVIHAVMLAVIIIVMAVPEGLPLMIAIVSALNMGKMLKDNVLVRKIAGIETAGSLNFLFSDKTGTITRGKLEVVTFIDGTGTEYKAYKEVQPGIKQFLSLSIHQNTDSVVTGAGAHQRAVGGNATERAILGFSMGEAGAPVKVTTVGKIPFNSTNKYSATTINGDYNLTLIKGAPEKILEKCKYHYNAEGIKKPYTGHAELNARIDALAERAIRVLAIAVSEEKIINNESLPENDWILVGIVGIRDEVRPESITAISEVQDAGVHVVMITGDRKETAVAIARDAGLLKNKDDLVITSDELGTLTDEQIKEKMPRLKVVARALPTDKSRLVRITQELNYVVGMTGDGVNDSPALKKADVGFAMGGGTEVAKEASEIVILDDNFSSIDKAILYGRTIFNSIRKFIIFQLTINVSAVLVNFVAPLFGQENPLTITQILWVNLVMDTLAALAFGGEPALQRFMKEAPKRRDEPIVSPYMWTCILTGALWAFVLSAVYLFTTIISPYFSVQPDTFHTGYFAFFIFIAVFNAFNARTDKLNLFDNIAGNKNFLNILLIITVVQVLLVYLGREIFECYGLNLAQWGIVILFAVSIIPVDLIRKLVVAKKK